MPGIRLLKVDSLNYAAAFRKFLDHRVWTEDASFASLMQAFGSSAIGYGGGLSKAFEKLGYEVMHVVSNFQPLQARWALENGFEYSEGGWESEILCKQVEAFKPDVVLFQGMPVTPRDFAQRFPETLITLFSGYPMPSDCLPGAEVIFCCASNIVEYYQDLGLITRLTHHSFDETILEQVLPQESPRDYEFTFLGSSGFNLGMASSGRYWALFEMLRRTPLVAWLDEDFGVSGNVQGEFDPLLPDHPWSGGFLAQAKELGEPYISAIRDSAGLLLQLREGGHVESLLGRLHRICWRLHRVTPSAPLPLLPLRMLFPSSCHEPLFGLDMFETIGRSNIIFNRHTNFGIEKCVVGNMRLFEATGMGACLLTDMGTNLPSLFEPDYEVVAYSSEDDRLEKVGYLLNHPDKAREIGEAGMRRVMRDHTCLCRASEMDAVIRERLAMRSTG